MSERFKDFSNKTFEYTGPEILQMGPVTVNLLSWKSGLEYEKLRHLNSDSLAQYSVVDSSNLPKLSWGVDFLEIPVGEVTIWAIDIRNKMCRISYWIDSNYRRQGIASASIAMVCDQVFESLDIEEIEAPILESNEPSKNLINSLSFMVAGYEILTDKNNVQASHEVYLKRRPEDDNDIRLSDYVLDKYKLLKDDEDA